MKIGVFDSGFGGLDIFRNIIAVLPEYDFVYLGDTARTPYGSRSQETIYQYATEAVDFLFSQNCQLVIFACNTASAKALRKIQQEYLPAKLSALGEVGAANGAVNGAADDAPKIMGPAARRVLGVVVPAIEEALLLTKNKKIGVIGTESTIQSDAFAEELRKKDADAKVIQQSCPLLVPIVESEENHLEIVDAIIENYLQTFVGTDIDVLILGCTHYGILQPEIEKVLRKLGINAQIVSEGKVVARKTKEYLARHPDIDGKLSKNNERDYVNGRDFVGKREFYTTDLTEKFQKIGAKLLGQKIVAKKVNLGNL